MSSTYITTFESFGIREVSLSYLIMSAIATEKRTVRVSSLQEFHAEDRWRGSFGFKQIEDFVHLVYVPGQA